MLALSIDTVYTHKAWHDNELSFMLEKRDQIPYPMLSDLGGKIGTLYGVFDEDEMLNLRGTFLIDPEGVVQSIQVINANVGRSVDEMLRQAMAFQHSQETGEVMPADWQPERKTLIPTTELAGKVMDEWKPGE